VDTFRPGDAVYGDLSADGFGAFAEYARAPASSLARMPAGMTFEQAAAIPQAGMLAWQGLVDAGRIQSRQRVLLNGAGGGVGTFGVQIARLYEAEVTVVDKSGKLQMLRDLGADHVIDYEKEDFTRGDDGYDLILDVKTNRSPLAYLRALKPNGTYVTVGGHTDRLLQTFLLSPMVSILRRRRLRVVALRPNKDLAEMNRLFDDGKLQPVMEGPYGFS